MIERNRKQGRNREEPKKGSSREESKGGRKGRSRHVSRDEASILPLLQPQPVEGAPDKQRRQGRMHLHHDDDCVCIWRQIRDRSVAAVIRVCLFTYWSQKLLAALDRTGWIGWRFT